MAKLSMSYERDGEVISISQEFEGMDENTMVYTLSKLMNSIGMDSGLINHVSEDLADIDSNAALEDTVNDIMAGVVARLDNTPTAFQVKLLELVAHELFTDKYIIRRYKVEEDIQVCEREQEEG